MKCNVTGKSIYPDKETARKAIRHLRTKYKGRAVAKWCIFCETYHVTKGLHGNKGKGDFR